MILTDEQAIAFIKLPSAKAEIEELRKECKMLCAHVTGKNKHSYLTDLPYYERDELRDERHKMMISSVDLIASMLAPRNRIFSAKGGIEHFIITDQKKEQDFRVYLDNITQGLSLKKWIQKFAIRRNDYDPNGIILIEQDTKGKIYPCFKSILNIHDRQLNGRTPEYLILKLTEKEVYKLKQNNSIPKNVASTTDLFRVIDDTTDRLFYKDRIVPNSTVPSFSAPKFPGLVSSNIPSDEDGIFYSPINDCKERLTQYNLWLSLYNLVFARQAFPKEYMQRIDCAKCAGTGQINSQPCPECHGEGIYLSQKPADYIIIDWGDENNKNIPNPPMGRNEAPVDTLESFAASIESLKDVIYYIFWGMYKSDKVSAFKSGVTRDTIGSNIEPTAYQAMLNAQPMVTKLVECAEWYVEIYRLIVNIIGSKQLGDAYKGCSIIPGDRFMIESPDATWDRYLKAKTSKAPLSELCSILDEYIENKYANNPILYRRYKLLKSVEPFLHVDVDDVLTWDIPEVQKKEKQYYASWEGSMSDWEFTVIADGLNNAENGSVVDADSDEEDDDVEPFSNVKVNPVDNLKVALRTYTLLKMKDDSGLAKPIVTDNAIPIPSNSTMITITNPNAGSGGNGGGNGQKRLGAPKKKKKDLNDPVK